MEQLYHVCGLYTGPVARYVQAVLPAELQPHSDQPRAEGKGEQAIRWHMATQQRREQSWRHQSYQGTLPAHAAQVMHSEQPDLPDPQPQGTPRGRSALYRTQPVP